MGAGSQPDLWEKLPELNLPALFIAGEKDWKFQRLAAEMANLCPNGEVAIMAESGHNVHFENPETYTQTVKQFVSTGVKS